MNPTLTEILAALFQAHQAIDRLQAELAQRDQRIAQLEAPQHFGNDELPPGWRLVKDS